MFDEREANYAEKFISLLKLTDDFYGEPFVLMDWQREIIRNVYGTMNERGTRKYRNVYLEVPKKNAKSQLLGAIACLHLFKPTEPNSSIYGCAGTRKQAGIIFDATVQMIEQVPALLKKCRIQRANKRIVNKQTRSSYEVLSSESFSAHGYKTSVVLFDELHVQPNRRLWDVMTKGTGLGRRQPMWWVITTAGMDPDRVTIGWEVHEKAEAILQARESGDAENDIQTWYPVIYGYQGEDIWNVENWKKANPALGTIFSVEDLAEIAEEAKLSPADELAFRWLHLNQWPTTKLTTWLPLELFDETAGDWDRAELLGKRCYMGADLAETTDLTGICLLFPPQEGLEGWRAIWEAVIPEEEMQDRIARDRVPYDQWREDGWITATEGNVMDYEALTDLMLRMGELYEVAEVDLDRRFAAPVIQTLEKNGMTCVDIPQKYATLTDPMNHIEILLKNGQMSHEYNPVARWCFGNTSIATNGNGYIKYVKERRGKHVQRTKRIDLTVALVVAMARAMIAEAEQRRSVYEERGFLTI